jgi:hypothetical protein
MPLAYPRLFSGASLLYCRRRCRLTYQKSLLLFSANDYLMPLAYPRLFSGASPLYPVSYKKTIPHSICLFIKAHLKQPAHVAGVLFRGLYRFV